MFFFENYTALNLLFAIILIVLLYLINEAARRNQKFSILLFICIPIVFTFLVWPTTAGKDSSSGYWFAWVKTYSALAGVIGFMLFRYIPKLQNKKIMLAFPGFILAINILEAVLRDFQVYSIKGVLENGLYLQGGIWNILNGISGIIVIITLSGFLGIHVSKNKFKDMVWPDQQWFYVIGYCLWNMSYVYNCIPNRSFYAGFILLSLSIFAGLYQSKGVWLQHRAQILAIFAMFSLTYPAYSSTKFFSITSTLNQEPLLVLSIISIVFNVGLLIFHIYKIIKTKSNPFKNEVYKDLKSYQKAIELHK